MRQEENDFETFRQNLKFETKAQKRKIDISALGPECPMPPELEIIEENKLKSEKSISRLLRISTVLLTPVALLLFLPFSFADDILGFLTGLIFLIPFFALIFFSFFCLKSAKTYRILLKKAKPHCYMARIKTCYAPGSLWEDGTEMIQRHVDLEFSNGHIESQLIVNVDNTDRRLSVNTGDDVYVYIREYGDLQRRDIVLVDEIENRKEDLGNAL